MIEIPRIKELTNPPSADTHSWVWSPVAADYNSCYFSGRRGTNSFLFVGAWVKRI